MDNIRVIGGSQVARTRGMYRIDKLTNYLGEIQLGSGEIHHSHQIYGQGASMKIDNGNIYVSTSQEKWDKGRAILNGWWDVYMKDPENNQLMFEHKDMERKREVVVHLSILYLWMKLLLKGLYHSLENWKGSRDIDGWKF